jgi:hypothetical protein
MTDHCDKSSCFPSSGTSFGPHINLVELLGRVINQSQGLCDAKTGNNGDIHSLNGIQNHDPYVPVGEDSAIRRSRGYFDPQFILLIMQSSVDAPTHHSRQVPASNIDRKPVIPTDDSRLYFHSFYDYYGIIQLGLISFVIHELQSTYQILTDATNLVSGYRVVK